MTTFALLLMLAVPQSAPAQQAPKPYTVPAIGLPQAFLDSSGSPVAYVDWATFYTWSGTPVAYYTDENLYRFDGKHLGWYHDRRIYDHEGRVVVVAASLSEHPRASIPSHHKLASPIKAPKELAPAMPTLTSEWSARSALEFFTGGK